jgi:ribosomal protein S18 acetylase RimI-like enzyme
MVNFQITNYNGTKEDGEIITLLTSVFVEEGYTDKLIAKKMFTSVELQKRGEIILARSCAGKLLGMVIFVRPSSLACQVAKMDEAEIHLLVVYPKVRGQGIATQLIIACEQRVVLLGYFKMVLSTQQSMKGAHRLYEHLGYHRNSRRDWSKEDKIFFVYEKLLSI